eukprot:5333292-Prymnesium_polylepis.2
MPARTSLFLLPTPIKAQRTARAHTANPFRPAASHAMRGAHQQPCGSAQPHHLTLFPPQSPYGDRRLCELPAR